MKLPQSAMRLVFASTLVLSSVASLSFAYAADDLLSLARSCGKNAYRSAGGDCLCKSHYEVRNGKCVPMRHYRGADALPSDKPGCWTWLKMCKENDVAACQFYEGTCT